MFILLKAWKFKGDNMEEVTKIFNYLIDYNYFTFEELQLLTNINGYSVDTLNDAIYSRYGFNDFSQLIGEDNEEEDEE